MNIETDITAILRDCKGKTPAETFVVLAKEVMREVLDKHLDELQMQRDENPNTHEGFGYRDALDDEMEQADDIRQHLNWFGYEEEK